MCRTAKGGGESPQPVADTLRGHVASVVHIGKAAAWGGRSPSSPTTDAPLVEHRAAVRRCRPTGLLAESDMALGEVPIEDLADEEVLVETQLLSIDAFLRTMLDEEAYHGSIKLGATLPALGIGTVIASKSKRFKPGASVVGMLGAQSHAKVPAAGCFPAMKLPGMSDTAALGALSLTTGITAWVGIHAVAKPPRRGDVVVVSAAAGGVGSVAAQLAKLRGARVIGIAGGPHKTGYLRDGLGIEAVDYKDGDASIGEQLDALAPDGVDFFFDNAGGEALDAVLNRLRPKARVIICGAASQYSGKLNVGKVDGPSAYLKLAERGASMHGYNVMQYMGKVPKALAHLWWLLLRGKISMREQVEAGVASFGPALVKMFTGGHIGKLLVDVSAAKPTGAR